MLDAHQSWALYRQNDSQTLMFTALERESSSKYYLAKN